MVWVIFLYFFFAANLILRKMILNHCQPIFFQGTRLTLAGILILGYLFAFHRDWLRLERKDIPLFLQTSLFFSYLSYLFAVITLDDLSSARFAFMFNLTPFITAILSYFYLKERLTRKEFASLIIGFIGFMPLVFVGQKDGINSASFFSIPGLQLFIATAAYAYGWIVIKELVSKRSYSPLLITGVAFFSGGIAILLTSFVFENWFTMAPVTNIMKFTTYLIGIVFISEIIASNIYALLLKRYSATFLAFAGVLYPLFSALLAWLFLKESISINFFVSAIIVSLALYIFYLSENEKQHKGLSG